MLQLEEIIVSPGAIERVGRAANHEAENRALKLLTAELEKPGGDVLAKLAGIALELCDAHSAGISLIESDGIETVFRWHAVVGQWAKYAGGGLPRSASPCGVVIDRKATLLMRRPGLHFELVARAEPEVVEVLLAPFYLMGEAVGTVWVIAHDDTRRFDAEDVRIVESLAQVASSSHLVRCEIKLAQEARDEALRSNERLKRTNQRLAGDVI